VTTDKKDNLIPFPTDRMKNKNKTGTRPLNEEVQKKLYEQQTKEFVEGNVDEIAYSLLDKFVAMGLKTAKMTFTADLALVIDAIRGLIYRDFGKPHPAQMLTDKMVQLNVKGNNKTARLNYNELLGIKHKTHKPISKEVEEELRDLADMADIQFSPDKDILDNNGKDDEPPKDKA